ncbi:MAG: cyclic nucleotide-binding domain-containing protein [Deltaproteobacteria bacterium]|nr:MAG: cyclic nucleotide-binding domain-containing protein [Deltaproteobacteria bacterium]
MMDARIALLQDMSIFGAVKSDSLALLLERAHTLHVPKGDYFFREGDVGTSLYVLERGRVTIVKTWQGTNYVINSLECGDFFGEIALLDFMPRSASVIAEEDCQALVFRALDVLEIAKQDIEQFTMIYMNICRELGRRLRAGNELLFESRVRYQHSLEDYSFTI